MPRTPASARNPRPRAPGARSPAPWRPRRRAGVPPGRHPVLTWILRVVLAARLAMLLLFVAYVVSVQVNAVAYLAGSSRPIVGGTAPPTPLDSAAAAVAYVIAGLVFEAVAAFIILIAVVLLRARIRER